MASCDQHLYNAVYCREQQAAMNSLILTGAATDCQAVQSVLHNQTANSLLCITPWFSPVHNLCMIWDGCRWSTGLHVHVFSDSYQRRSSCFAARSDLDTSAHQHKRLS